MAVIDYMYYVNRIEEAGDRFITLYGFEQFEELMETVYTFDELCVGGNVDSVIIEEATGCIRRIIRQIQSGVRRREMEDTFINELQSMIRILETRYGYPPDYNEDTSDSDGESVSENEDKENEDDQYENDEGDVFSFDGDDIHINEKNDNN